jgi:hypothetical protein
MNKQIRIILFISYAIIGLVIENFIFYLFPFTGLGGLVCYPFSLILSILFGWIIYKATKKLRKVGSIVLVFLGVLSFQIIIALAFQPQDFGGTPFEQIADCNRALNRYDKIRFDDFSDLSSAERVVYIYKFKNKLPQSISILTIDSTVGDGEVQRNYEFKNYLQGKIYDTTQLKIEYTNDSLIIIEAPLNPLKADKHTTEKTLLDNVGGGTYDRKNSIFYDVTKDSFELKTGFEKLFYKYLSLTKKAVE